MPDNIDEKNLVLCNACLCCNTSLFLDMPDLIGCSGEGKCLCIHDAFCCKPGTDPYKIGLSTDAGDHPDGNICEIALYCCKLGLNKPFICCQGQNHCFCLVGNAALPPTDEVPLFCSLCTVACFPTFGVFKKQSELK